MKKDVYVFEVNEKNFDESVLQNSATLPVVVEFMGFWSEPCVMLSGLWTDLANEFASQFIFATVDIDDHTELRKKYQIENIPTTKVFIDGEVVATEEGQLTEDECRAMLKQTGVFHESDELRLQAREMHLSGDTQQAFILLTEAIKKDPQNTRVAMDMVQIFLDTGMLDNANALYNKLPQTVKETTMGRTLTWQLTFANQAAETDGKDILSERVAADGDDHASRFDLAICLIAEYEIMLALEELFIILQKKPDFRDGAAKEMVIVLINSLKEKQPELAQQTQLRLSNLLAE